MPAVLVSVLIWFAITFGASGLVLDPDPAPAPQSEATAPKKPVIVTNPSWARIPSREEIQAAYPTKALMMGRSGRVVMRCETQIDGTLKDCAILSETPTSYGFGDAALSLARRFKMHPETRDGVPVCCKVINIPMNFG